LNLQNKNIVNNALEEKKLIEQQKIEEKKRLIEEKEKQKQLAIMEKFKKSIYLDKVRCIFDLDLYLF
jgi:hypothetical protein